MSYPLKGFMYPLQSILHLNDVEPTGSATYCKYFWQSSFSVLISSCVALWTVTGTVSNAFPFLDPISFGNWKSSHINRVDNEPMDCGIWRAWSELVHCHYVTSTDLTYFWGHSCKTPSLRCIHMYTWTSVTLYFGMIHYHFNRNYTFQNLVKTQIF